MTSKADQTLINEARKAIADGDMPPSGVRIDFSAEEPIEPVSEKELAAEEKDAKKKEGPS